MMTDREWLIVTKHPVREDEWDPLDIEMGVAEVVAESRLEALKEGVRQLREQHPDYFLDDHNPFGQVFAELVSDCNECGRRFGDGEEHYVVEKPVPYNAHWHVCESCYAKPRPVANSA